MGGLGNGRRGGRSPPLMIGALVACILVLGFNYWVSSSRNLELQTKLYELEGQVRRGAAERGVAEMKKNEFQEEIQRQKEQISRIESLYKRQLEGALHTCSQEKAVSQQNISSSTKTIQELKGQLNQLNDDLGKLEKELQSCQGNIKTLNKKLTYDMTHCHSEIQAQKEQCNEKVEAAILEVKKKMEKLVPSSGAPSQQENVVDKAGNDDGPAMTVVNTLKASAVVNHTQSLSQPEENDAPELLTNEIVVDKAVGAPVDLPGEDLSEAESHAVPSASAVKQDILLPPGGAVTAEEGGLETSQLSKSNQTEGKGTELLDAHEEGTQTEDPGMEGMLAGQAKAGGTADNPKTEEAEEYEADEQEEGGDDLDKKQQSKQDQNIDLEEELADYNGDEENEGEFEADKQAALAQN